MISQPPERTITNSASPGKIGTLPHRKSQQPSCHPAHILCSPSPSKSTELHCPLLEEYPGQWGHAFLQRSPLSLFQLPKFHSKSFLPSPAAVCKPSILKNHLHTMEKKTTTAVQQTFQLRIKLGTSPCDQLIHKYSQCLKKKDNKQTRQCDLNQQKGQGDVANPQSGFPKKTIPASSLIAGGQQNGGTGGNLLPAAPECRNARTQPWWTKPAADRHLFCFHTPPPVPDAKQSDPQCPLKQQFLGVWLFAWFVWGFSDG